MAETITISQGYTISDSNSIIRTISPSIIVGTSAVGVNSNRGSLKKMEFVGLKLFSWYSLIQNIQKCQSILSGLKISTQVDILQGVYIAAAVEFPVQIF